MQPQTFLMYAYVANSIYYTQEFISQLGLGEGAVNPGPPKA